MSLTPGTRLGPYDIVAPLGAGGMGEVYRARDTKLNRDVALKILPDTVAQDADRVARFKREAQVLASLNHPHIAAIYGFDEAAGTQFLVLELVEGETLADRIKRGPIPVDETIVIARQIAEALAEAHEKGIIHRDLKPANIALSGHDQVKVLDFGLAKLTATSGGGASSSVSMSPTLTTPAMVTGVGMILGTAAYMAPEQAKGREADKRCDVWAFGCVIYEMLTAKRAFEGEDVTDTIASIMRGEPDWSALPADTPANLRLLLESCLTKDRKQRAADIAVVQFLLSDRAIVPSAAPMSETAQTRTQWKRFATAAAILLVAIGAAVIATTLLLNRPAPAAARVAFDLITPEANGPLHLALSPDGSRLVALARTEKGSALWLRTLEHVTGQTIPESEWSNASTGSGFPFWSPDGRFVGFFADGKLKKIDLSGAPFQTVTDARNGHGGTWNRDGVILFAPDNVGPLFRVSAAGGAPAQVTELDPKRLEIAHRHPAFLLDGKHFLYLAVSAKPENTGVFVGSIDSKERTFLVAAQSRAAFAPPDQLLFVRLNTLMAQRIDMKRFELRGDPVRVADRVGSNVSNSAAGFTVSENGVLAWRLGTENAGESQLSWLDREGKPIGTIGGPAVYRNPTLSPDQQRVVVDQEDARTRDLWILDVVRGTKSRFTFDPADDRAAIWSPDGARIVFESNRADGLFNLYQKNAGGAGNDELLLKSAHNTRPEDWSSDGRFILYRDLDPKTKADLWVLPLTGDRKPQPVLRSEFNEMWGRFSPDGRWIAYVSDESGQSQVYVQTFPVSGTKYQISTQGGVQPKWRADGKELLFLSTTGMNAVELSVAENGGLRAGVPKLLFPVRVQAMNSERSSWDIAADGRRFLINSSVDQGTNVRPITVVLNWLTGLKQ